MSKDIPEPTATRGASTPETWSDHVSYLAAEAYDKGTNLTNNRWVEIGLAATATIGAIAIASKFSKITEVTKFVECAEAAETTQAAKITQVAESTVATGTANEIVFVQQRIEKVAAVAGPTIRTDINHKIKQELTDKLALDAHSQAKLNELNKLDGCFHRATMQFIQEAPERNLALVRREFNGDTPAELLSQPLRMKSLSELEQKLSPDALQSLRDIEPQDKSIMSSMQQYIGALPQGQTIIERLVAQGAPTSHFNYQRLWALAHLEKRFGTDSEVMARLLKLESEAGLNLNNANTLESPKFVARLLSHENPAETINALGGAWPPVFSGFAKALGDTSDALDAIEKASPRFLTDNLNIKKLTNFIDSQPDRAALVIGEISAGTSSARLNDKYWLPSLSLLKPHLGSEPELLQKALTYGEEGKLNLWQLGAYVDLKPEERVNAVKELIKNGTPEKAKNLLRLTMFSQKTSQDIANLAEDGAIKLEEVIKHARDLEYGHNFVTLVARHVERTGSLSPELLGQLAEEAAHSAPLAAGISGSEILATQGVARSVTSADPIFIEKMSEATEIMLSKFSPDRPLVMLSRDMDALTPVLRANGRQTINFPFSRLQLRDQNTAAQWLIEVPPNAIVVDSKLQGTILGAIQRFDPTIEPYLLQSRSKFPQLLPDSHYGLADRIEYFPKLTGRCSGFRPSGAAICRIKNTDQEDIVSPSRMALELRQSIMQKMGLSDWHVWRYKNFTSVPQSERIGISSPGRVKDYLEDVKRQRTN